MADIPENENPIQIEGARFRSPVSESLIQLIGGAINFGLARRLRIVTFLTGITNFQIPQAVEVGAFFGMGGGGGGGGGGGAWEPNNFSAKGGAGGGGAYLFSTGWIPVLELDNLVIDVGAGGVGGNGGVGGGGTGATGGNGGNTTVTGFTNGHPDIFFPGARGGSGGQGGNFFPSDPVTFWAEPTVAPTSWPVDFLENGIPPWPGGDGGGTKSGVSFAGSSPPSKTSLLGGTVPVSTGGVAGSQSGGGYGGGGGGGGASSHYGAGGNGGRGANNGASNDAPGDNAAVLGAGGGGGGAGDEATSNPGSAGGAGGDGICYFVYFGKA